MSDTPETKELKCLSLIEVMAIPQERREIALGTLRAIKERDEAREAAAKWESSSDAMERAGAEQARRADENREWALRAERERDEARAELADHKSALEIANRSADDQMRQKRLAERERDEAREEVRLLKAILDLIKKDVS